MESFGNPVLTFKKNRENILNEYQQQAELVWGVQQSLKIRNRLNIVANEELFGKMCKPRAVDG